MFESELERIKGFTLYFLEIKADQGTFHKIGITGRTIEQRLEEVKKDIKKLFGVSQTIVIGTIRECPFLELFFKHKYRRYQLDLKTHTEYFKLPQSQLNEIKECFSRLEV